MSNITEKVVSEATEMLGNILRIYREKIDKAYLKEDGALSIALGLKFKPADGDIEVETSINFVTDRIKNAFHRTVREAQDDLFSKKAEAPQPAPTEKPPEPERPEMKMIGPALPAITAGDAEVIDAEVVSEVNEFGVLVTTCASLTVTETEVDGCKTIVTVALAHDGQYRYGLYLEGLGKGHAIEPHINGPRFGSVEEAEIAGLNIAREWYLDQLDSGKLTATQEEFVDEAICKINETLQVIHFGERTPRGTGAAEPSADTIQEPETAALETVETAAEVEAAVTEGPSSVNDAGVLINPETVTVTTTKVDKTATEIRIALAPDGLYRFSTSVQKGYGDYAGRGYAPNIRNQGYATKDAATIAGLKEARAFYVKDEDKEDDPSNSKLLDKTIAKIDAAIKLIMDLPEAEAPAPKVSQKKTKSRKTPFDETTLCDHIREKCVWGSPKDRPPCCAVCEPQCAAVCSAVYLKADTCKGPGGQPMMSKAVGE